MEDPLMMQMHVRDVKRVPLVNAPMRVPLIWVKTSAANTHGQMVPTTRRQVRARLKEIRILRVGSWKLPRHSLA